MNRRLAAEDHHRACAVGERGVSPFNQLFHSHRFTGTRIPARSARDAEIAAQVAAAQRDGECRDQFQLVRHFGLSHENAGLGAGVTKPGFAGQAIHPAMMFAQVAIRQ